VCPSRVAVRSGLVDQVGNVPPMPTMAMSARGNRWCPSPPTPSWTCPAGATSLGVAQGHRALASLPTNRALTCRCWIRTLRTADAARARQGEHGRQAAEHPRPQEISLTDGQSLLRLLPVALGDAQRTSPVSASSTPARGPTGAALTGDSLEQEAGGLNRNDAFTPPTAPQGPCPHR